MIPFTPHANNKALLAVLQFLSYHSENIAYVLVCIAGYSLFQYMNKKKKLGVHLGWFIVYTLTFGLVFSRLWYFIDNWENLWSIILFFDITKPGLVSVGYIIGIILGSFFYVYVHEKKTRASFFPQWTRFSDEAAATLGINVFVFRSLGCYLYGDVVGTLTTVPWAIQLVDGSVRHPTALYFAFFGLIVFCVCLILFRYRQWKGQITIAGITLYLIGRFFLDFFRVTENFYYSLSFIQVFSFIAAMIGIVLYVTITKTHGQQKNQHKQ